MSVEGIQLAADAALSSAERLFFYLPLEHAESLEAQDLSISAFERLVAEAAPGEREFSAGLLGFAHKHRDLIVKFGRFPHRNQVLGRANTPEETVWLTEHPNYFG